MGCCQTYGRLVAAATVQIVIGCAAWYLKLKCLRVDLTNTITILPVIYTLLVLLALLQEVQVSQKVMAKRKRQCHHVPRWLFSSFDRVVQRVAGGRLMPVIGIVRSTLSWVNFISFSVCDYSIYMIIWTEIAHIIDHGFQCWIYFNNAWNIKEQTSLDNVDVLLVQVVFESLCVLPFFVMFDFTISTANVNIMLVVIGCIFLKAKCIFTAEAKRIRTAVYVQAREVARNINANSQRFNISLFCYCLLIVVFFNTLIIIQVNDLDRILESKDIDCGRDLYYCTSVFKLENDCQRWTRVGNRHENESQIPPQLLRYKHIKYIELTFTKIDTVPEVTKRWKKLVYLNMKNNQLKNFEVNTLVWENLLGLVLNFNRDLAYVPGVWKHPSLAVLSLANTSVQTMASEEAYLPRLYYLDVGYSRVAPSQFSEYAHFPMLYTAIYSGIPAGSSFKYAGNEIAIADAGIETIRIPDILRSSRLHKLLDLRGNKIETLDDESLHFVQRWGTLLSGNPICLTHSEKLNCSPEIGNLDLRLGSQMPSVFVD